GTRKYLYPFIDHYSPAIVRYTVKFYLPCFNPPDRGAGQSNIYNSSRGRSEAVWLATLDELLGPARDKHAKSSQMRLGLPSTPVVGDRCGVSDRAVAAIASSVLDDVGLITSNNSDLVVDENKLRREGLM
ncbi:hypothetical protein AVEN_238424-1, partial [Araneus ventricosus]